MPLDKELHIEILNVKPKLILENVVRLGAKEHLVFIFQLKHNVGLKSG